MASTHSTESYQTNRAFRIALFCGAAPLLLGISIFLLWVLTRWNGLMLAGFLTLFVGAFLFLVGVAALALSWRQAQRREDVSRRRVWLSTIGGAGLLLSNFAVVGGISVAAIAIHTSYTVKIRNTSQQAINEVRISGGGCDISFGSIPPGGSVQKRFRIQQDGELAFSAVRGQARLNSIIDDYVTGNMGGDTTVTIKPDGSISIGK